MVKGGYDSGKTCIINSGSRNGFFLLLLSHVGLWRILLHCGDNVMSDSEKTDAVADKRVSVAEYGALHYNAPLVCLPIRPCLLKI